MYNLQVQDLRLSFIWVRCFTELIEQPKLWVPILSKVSEDLGSLSIPEDYKALFEQIQSEKINIFQLPWSLGAKNKKYAQNFWRFYLMDERDRERVDDLSDVKKERAWKQLIPFRSKVFLPYKVEVPDSDEFQGGKVFLESFYYPFGWGLVISVNWNLPEQKPSLTPENIFQIAKEIDRKEFYVHWTSSEGEKLTLYELGNACSDKIFGENPQPLKDLNSPPDSNSLSTRPFKIATIVRGDLSQQYKDVSDGDEVHRMLEMLTSFKKRGAEEVLTKLDDCRITFSEEDFKNRFSPKHWLYKHTRGRAVFFPDAFVNSLPQSHKLSCYHRNLVMASLQVDSLGSLVRSAYALDEEERRLTPLHKFFAKRATGILRRLCAYKSYKSPSIKVQIKDTDNLPEAIKYIEDNLMNIENNI